MNNVGFDSSMIEKLLIGIEKFIRDDERNTAKITAAGECQCEFRAGLFYGVLWGFAVMSSIFMGVIWLLD